MKTSALFFLALTLTAVARGPAGDHREAFGPLYRATPHTVPTPRHVAGGGEISSFRRWNSIAIDASGLDHTPVAPLENRVFGEQLGPCRAARAMAIVHIAMADSMNAVMGAFESYTGVQAPDGPVSIPAAISQAAHDTLAALFPSQAASFHTALAADLAGIPNDEAKINGVDLGRRAAIATLESRTTDGSEHLEPRLGVDYFTSDLPGRWRQDPISQIPIALGARWFGVRPFVMLSGNQFRVPPPPAMTSAEYAIAYEEVKRLGGDGIVTPTARTPDQTHVGIFWAYDGTPSLCAPPRLYNQVAVQIADQRGTSDTELARLLVLVNVAMADAGIAVWDSKFFYDFWRPVLGVREADPGTGPTGLGDGNPATAGDSTFLPLCAPASNLQGPDFTPPFPAYPSGHAGFGGALFQILRRFYGTDNLPFTFVSDEYNGVTRSRDGTVRPYLPRSFSTLSQAEEENGQSRIYLGIHWSFDKTEGIAQGRDVADYVFSHTFAANPGQSVNISTRMRVTGGDNALIGGFIVQGSPGSSKKVIVRALGPSLGSAGLPGTMTDPTLTLYNSAGQVVAVNDNWRTNQAEVLTSGLPPENDLESAIVTTLASGTYTTVLRGVGGATGIALTEVYDLDQSARARLANISSRGQVQTGDSVMIAGFMVGGAGPTRVLVRALGPSLANSGVRGVLPDPMLELQNSNGTVITNQNWRDTQESEIIATTIPPTDNREAAILANLPPGPYTAVVKDANNASGIGLVEVYNLQ